MTDHVLAPAAVGAISRAPKRKPSRPAGAARFHSVAPAETGLTVPTTPEERALLAEWAEAKQTTPEALAREALEGLLERVAVFVDAYRRRRAAFDATAVAEIEGEATR
jgi:hypothetical protein